MKQIGYYAKDKDGNLFRFEWSSENEFSITLKGGTMQTQDPNDYEIIRVGQYTDDYTERFEVADTQTYHTLRNKLWEDLVNFGVMESTDMNFEAFDTVLGKNIDVTWD